MDRKKPNYRRRFLFIPCLSMLVAMTVSALVSAQAAIDLLYFTGYGDEDSTYLEWETATEIDTSGFYIRRSASENGTYTRMPEASPEFIVATGEGPIGDYYYFIDEEVVNGTGYWYKLEIIDTNNQSTFHNPPIQVIAGVYETETPSHSVSPTVVATTPFTSNQTPIINPTATLAPTRAQPASPIPYPAATQPLATTPTTPPVSVTEAITPTTTLLPAPALTLQFPTPMDVVGSSSLQTGLVQPETEPANERTAWFTFERLVFLGFILLIWVILGGWFFFSYRRLE